MQIIEPIQRRFFDRYQKLIVEIIAWATRAVIYTVDSWLFSLITSFSHHQALHRSSASFSPHASTFHTAASSSASPCHASRQRLIRDSTALQILACLLSSDLVPALSRASLRSSTSACACRCSSTGPTTRRRILWDQPPSAPLSNHPLGSRPTLREGSTSGQDILIDQARNGRNGLTGKRRGVVSESDKVGEEERSDERVPEAKR